MNKQRTETYQQFISRQAETRQKIYEAIVFFGLFMPLAYLFLILACCG